MAQVKHISTNVYKVWLTVSEDVMLTDIIGDGTENREQVMQSVIVDGLMNQSGEAAAEREAHEVERDDG